MNLQTKMLLFYLSLEEVEREKFKRLIGIQNFNRIVKRSEIDHINDYTREFLPLRNKDDLVDDYDIAVMQIVKQMGILSESNVDLATHIERIIDKDISRPDKRSRYELQGMLLEALMNAPKRKLITVRNDLIHSPAKSKKKEKAKSNLNKWFDIILRDTK